MNRKNKKTKIDQMMQNIEHRGGIVGISSNAPDWLVEEFLESVIDCPECQEEAEQLRSRQSDH